MKTDTENWNLLQTLFHLAEEAGAEDRDRVLAEHCSDPELIRRALDLISTVQSHWTKPFLCPGRRIRLLVLDPTRY